MGLLEWTYLGPVDYGRALDLQADCAEQVSQGAPPRLLMLEHPPVITLGRQAKQQNLCLSEAEYKRRGIALHRIKRGGDVTFHGPGQLIAYPIASLTRLGVSVPEWVQGNARAVCGLLGEHGVFGCWSDTHPGVWVDGAKIAALGFHISRGISTHGLALNVSCDLQAFETIVPCGLANRAVTSLQQLDAEIPCMSELASQLAQQVARVFGLTLRRCSLNASPEGRDHDLTSSA